MPGGTNRLMRLPSTASCTQSVYGVTVVGSPNSDGAVVPRIQRQRGVSRVSFPASSVSWTNARAGTSGAMQLDSGKLPPHVVPTHASSVHGFPSLHAAPVG